MIAIATEKTSKKATGATECEHPDIGEQQLDAYLAGDMAEDAHREFVAHLGDCMYCLEQIVRWKMAEELAETADQHSQAAHAV